MMLEMLLLITRMAQIILVAYYNKIYTEDTLRRFIDDGHPVCIGRGYYYAIPNGQTEDI